MSPFWPPPNDSETLSLAFRPARLHSIIPPNAAADFGLIVVFSQPNGGHLRLRPRPPLYFLMGCVSAPKTREPTAAPPNQQARALHGTIGSGGAMSWWHHSSTHGGRGQKQLGGRAASAHFGCCVLCVVCVVVANCCSNAGRSRYSGVTSLTFPQCSFVQK